MLGKLSRVSTIVLYILSLDDSGVKGESLLLDILNKQEKEPAVTESQVVRMHFS